METNYTERVNKLRSSLDKATARKEDRERELAELKTEYKDLVRSIKETYKCEPSELATLIQSKTDDIEKLLSDAETVLKDVNKNLGEQS